MKTRNRIINGSLLIVLSFLLIFSHFVTPLSFAAASIRLIIDGRDVTASAMPIIQNDRTFVPIRTIAEQLGATVEWNEKDRTVQILKDNASIKLKIDSRLIEYNKSGKSYSLSDVPPVIIKDRTFVPLRLISNALGIGIEWAGESRAVYVNSGQSSTFTPFFDMNILTVQPGQAITGKTELQASLPSIDLSGAAEIKYILLDLNTTRGDVVARGSQLDGKYSWIPRISDVGEKVLVAAIYDSNGNFIAGDSIPVNLNVNPMVNLTGVVEGQTITDAINLGGDINFIASYIKYEIINIDKGTSTVTSESDPYGTYRWAPQVEENGNYGFKITAYDENGKAYESQTITARAEVIRKLSLTGVSAGQTIDKPVNLLASRNFSVSETEYLLRDKTTGVETSIAKVPWGGFKWFPGPEISGNKEVLVRVKDTSGTIHESVGIDINLPGKAKLFIDGIGPNQVLTGPVKLTATSNVKLDSVNYVVTNLSTGERTIIASNQNPSVEFTYTPGVSENFNIQVEGFYEGTKILGEEIPFRVFLGKTYASQPIVEKSEFLGLASSLARTSWETTGMSAALPTAQAILETGWGQSVPVDKYTGKLSNNLFGIKGTSTAGSVISNTWEEYNGTTFRIDAEFRAYNNINESWNDHKALLLERERYQIFRDVMHDSTLGAWAIRRAGYATDSQYPIKLMNLIKQYDLQELDKIDI